MDDGGDDHQGEPRPGVKPGTMSALLEELAASDEPTRDAWDLALDPGSVIGRFEIVREIGRGGFGVVFEARDLELHRPVAFKAVRGHGGARLREERVVREAEAAAQLSHPNIVTLHDVGHAEHGPYLVLELLRGETLAERLSRGPLPLAEAVRVAAEVAKGLAHAHAAGVVHRDLKPANVFLCKDGQVKVLDFGLAVLAGRPRAPEGGTPGWMAPEQRQGAPMDERTDVWALGAILFRALAGRSPASSRLSVPNVPELEALLGKMLASNPVERPRDGKEASDALAPIARRLEAGAPVAPVRTRWRLGPRLRVGGVAAAVAAVALTIYLVTRPPAGAGLPVAGLPVADFAVADFANETHEPELDTLSDLLITALEQPTEPRLHVLTRSRMLDVLNQLGKKGIGRIDELLAREVGRRTGTRALLLATIRKLGGSYVVDMRALDPVKDVYLFTSSQRAPSQEAIFDLVDRLAGEARRWAKARTGPTARPLVSVTTSNPKAWNALARSREALDRFDTAEARRLADEALEADSGFALARYQRAMLEFWGDLGYGTPAVVVPYYISEHPPNPFDSPSGRQKGDELTALAEQLPMKEKFILLATLKDAMPFLDPRRESFAELQRMRDEVASAFPFDKEAVFYGGITLVDFGEGEAAIPYFERALQLDPGYRLAADYFWTAILEAGRAEKYLDRFRREAGDAYLAKALLSVDREGEAVEVLRRLAATQHVLSTDDFVAYRSTGYRIFRGRASEVEAMTKAWLGGTRSEDHPWLHRRMTYLLAMALAAQGKFTEASARFDDYRPFADPQARATLRVFLASASGSSTALRAALGQLEQSGASEDPWYAQFAIDALTFAGDLATAGQLAAKLLASPNARVLTPTYLQGLEAVDAWSRGDPEEAEAKFRSGSEHTFPVTRYYSLLWLGELSRARGSCEQAVIAFERARGLDYSDMLCDRFWTYPGLLHHLALCHERLGDLRKARERNDELLRLWAHADPDLPLLAEAKAMRARLEAK